jgi:YD repeat-containing protein
LEASANPTLTPPPASLPFQLGNGNDNEDLQFIGRLAEAAYYPQALTSQQILTHYQVGTTGVPGPTVTPTPLATATATPTATGTPRACQPTQSPDPSGRPWTSTCYGYDRLSQLTSVDAPTGVTGYGYDPAGNRVTRTLSGSPPLSYQYDRADRLTSVGSTSYTLNANGNTTARGSDSFGYDQANRLTRATIEGVLTTYGYDGDGTRTTKQVGTTATTRFNMDSATGLSVLLSEGRDDGTQRRTYVWGLGSSPAYAVDLTSGALTVYHADGLGSVRAADRVNSVRRSVQNDPQSC